MATRIIERVSFSGGKIAGTETAPLVEGVLLCGATSANKRRYRTEAFAGDRVKRYNGVPVFLNHGRDSAGRPYQEQIGTITNARHRPDGMPIGDIAVNPKKPFAEAFLWDAAYQPTACGMSHVAHCETVTSADGWQEITELVRVESVDVISAGAAATTKGLFEGKRVTGTTTIKEYAAALARHPKATTAQILKVKKLAEMGGMGDIPTDATAPPPDQPDADPTDSISDAFKSAINAIIDQWQSGDLDPAEALKKIKSLMASHDAVNTDSSSSDSSTDSTDSSTDSTDTTGESKQAANRLAALEECAELEYIPSKLELEALSLLSSPEKRKAYVAEQKKAKKVAEKVVSGGRSPGASGGKPVTESVPSTAAEFVKAIRE